MKDCNDQLCMYVCYGLSTSVSPSVGFCTGSGTSHDVNLDKPQVLLQTLMDSGDVFGSPYVLSTYLC